MSKCQNVNFNCIIYYLLLLLLLLLLITHYSYSYSRLDYLLLTWYVVPHTLLLLLLATSYHYYHLRAANGRSRSQKLARTQKQLGIVINSSHIQNIEDRSTLLQLPTNNQKLQLLLHSSIVSVEQGLLVVTSHQRRHDRK